MFSQENFFDQNTMFSTLELIFYPILLGSFVCGKEERGLWLKYTTCCKILALVVAPSLVEVEVVVYSLLVRWSWLVFVSLFGRGDLWLFG